MIGAEGDRRQLAATLRAFREETGLSTTKFAKRLGWSQSKVSKSERGVTAPSPQDVAAWARACGADGATADDLAAIAERVAAHVTEWRRALAPGRRRVQHEIHRLESAASLIRVFAPAVIVGLAQTRPYAEAMFRLDRPPIPDDEVPELVDARMTRQDVLTDETTQFELCMGEAALRRRLLGVADWRVQLEKLIELSHQPHVAVGVIPFGAEERVHQYHGYAILGDPERDDESIVLAETVTRALTVRSGDEIAEYVAHFQALRSAALEAEPLRVFLREMVDGLPER